MKYLETLILIFLFTSCNSEKQDVSPVRVTTEKNESISNHKIISENLTLDNYNTDFNFLISNPNFEKWADYFYPTEVHINWNIYTTLEKEEVGGISIILNYKGGSDSPPSKYKVLLDGGWSNLLVNTLKEFKMSNNGLELVFSSTINSSENELFQSKADVEMLKAILKVSNTFKGVESLERVAKNALKLKYRDVLYPNINQLPQFSIWVSDIND